MNKFASFVICFFTGTLAVLAVICLISPRLAWSKAKTLGVGLVRDWRVRIAVLGVAGVTFGTILIHPFFGVLASIAGNCYLFWGIKPRSNKIQVESAKDAIDDLVDQIDEAVKSGSGDPRVSIRSGLEALLRRFGVKANKASTKTEKASKKADTTVKVENA